MVGEPKPQTNKMTDKQTKEKQNTINLVLGGKETRFKKGNIPWNKGMKEFSKQYSMGFKKGHKGFRTKESYKAQFEKNTVWNKGLTKETDERVKKYAKKSAEGKTGKKLSKEHIKKLIDIAKMNPNFGMKGKKHSEEAKIKIKKSRAKQIFPVKDSSIEVKIQNFLKELNIEFFTHQYMKEIEHGYQCDILIPSKNMVIECDGDYWHNYPIGNELDHMRTKELLEKGFKVLRLWENEINNMELNDFKTRVQ